MKAPFNLSPAIEKAIIILAFLPVITMVYPKITAAAHTAQGDGQEKLVFHVNSISKSNSLSYAELEAYHLAEQAKKNQLLADEVRKYLEAKGSPLAVYAEEIIKQPQWQRALAISYVESNFGKHCHSNNCSGIGVSPSHPSWRKYPTKLDWFIDMNALLERPIYKERYTTCAKMRGVYVVPGSDRWVNGCNKVSNELLAITAQVNNGELVVEVK
ncbi:MAG TPA: hypothetical protein PKD79_00985 [Candidatus Doudnabacteria bacterium]|nr:hypothetical protein [Candidatus Doudnabacteria bacterium]